MEVNWGILQSGNTGNTLINAFQAGQANAQKQKEIERQDGVRSALSKYQTDPDGAVSALWQYDPETAMKLGDYTRGQKEAGARRERVQTYGKDPKAARQAAFAAGDQQQVMDFDKMDATQREATAANAKRAYAIVNKLGEMPYEQRKAAWQRLAPALSDELGIAPEVLAAVDPTDEWIVAKKIEGAEFAEKMKTFQTKGGDIVAVGEDGAQVLYDNPNDATAPAGYRFTPDGNLQAIPGGPADPGQAGRLAGAKRAPKAGGRGGAAQSKLPTGFILDP